MHNTSVQTVLKRPKGEQEKKLIACPTAIADYMGGVDQLLSYYTLTSRKALKWWKKVFWRLVDISVINSWIIFHANFPQSDIKTQRLFRLKLAEELTQPLLDLRASPVHLQDVKGRKPVTTEKRLTGMCLQVNQTSKVCCL